jgi:hypothetical protein
MIRCSHIWVDGLIDHGISLSGAKTSLEIEFLKMSNNPIPGLLRNASNLQHCEVCYLDRYIRDGKWVYNRYWQKQLRLNHEIVGSYIRQLRESETPMSFNDYIIMRVRQAARAGNELVYRTSDRVYKDNGPMNRIWSDVLNSDGAEAGQGSL